MNLLPPALCSLIDALRQLPGIGPKTAERLAFFLLERESSENYQLAEIINDFKKQIYFCTECANFSDQEGLCRICRDQHRNLRQICVVATPIEAGAIEKTGTYEGRYHILGGELSPIDGVGPNDLTTTLLEKRAKKLPADAEIIIATNPSVEGEATAHYLLSLLSKYKLKITRLARGLPTGGALEYADDQTLSSALEGRKTLPRSPRE